MQKLVGAYKLWHEFVPHFPKHSRYTLGAKIDTLFVETVEAAVIASYLPPANKLPYVEKASIKLDVLKVFLQVAWESKSLETKHYTLLSERLFEIGKMFGGWSKQLKTKTGT